MSDLQGAKKKPVVQYYESIAACLDPHVKPVLVEVDTLDAEVVKINFGGMIVLAALDSTDNTVLKIGVEELTKPAFGGSVIIIDGRPITEPDRRHGVTFQGYCFEFMWWGDLQSPRLIAASVPRKAADEGEGPTIDFTIIANQWSRMFSTSDLWCAWAGSGHMEGAVRATYIGPDPNKGR